MENLLPKHVASYFLNVGQDRNVSKEFRKIHKNAKISCFHIPLMHVLLSVVINGRGC